MHPPLKGLSEAHESLLVETLHRWAREPFHRVRANCAVSVLDYVEAVSGRRASPDPRKLRYLSRAACWGSSEVFIQYCEGVMASLGCPVIDAPQRGDVALVNGLAKIPTAAICVGDRWAVRGRREVIVSPAPVELAWRVTCPRR